MADIVASEFNEAMNKGLSSSDTNGSEVELYADGPTSADTTGSNPKSFIFARNGSKIRAPLNQWGTWELGSQQSLSEIRVRHDFTGTMERFLTVDGGDFGTTTADNIETGADVSVTDGQLELNRAGIAVAMYQGVSNIAFDAVILDGNSNELDRITGISVFYANEKLSADNDLTFSNNSGGQWSVEEFQIEEQSGNAYTIDTSVSANVADGGSITFTQAETTVDIFSP